MTSGIRLLFRRQHTWVIAIFLLALVLRLAWALYADADPRNVWRYDMTLYDHYAVSLADGKGFVDYWDLPSAHWPPGYPMALAPIYYLFDDSPLAAGVFNAVLGSATVALLYLLGSRIFGRRVGLTAALLLALFPNQVFFSSLTMTEILFTTILVLILLLVVYLMLGQRAPPLWQVGLVGALIGYAALVRGEGLLLMAFILPALLIRWRSWRRVLTYGAVLLAGMAVIIAPWTVRNLVRMKSPILISTSGTEALWVGHHAGADGRISEFDVGVRYENLPNPEREVKINDVALDEALTFIRRHPGEELQLIPKKLFALYNGDASGIRWLQLTEPTISTTAARVCRVLSNVYYCLVLLLAAAGAGSWFSLRHPPKALLVGIVIFWTLMFSIVFFGDRRFHFPIMPIFSLWAAASLVTMGDLLRKRWRPAPA